MQELMTWLTANSGVNGVALQAFGCMVAAIATVVTAIIAGFYTHYTKSLLKLTEIGNNSRIEPSIQITYERNQDMRSQYDLIIANYGCGLAKNIKLSCAPNVMGLGNMPLNETSPFVRDIPALAPGVKLPMPFNIGGSGKDTVTPDEFNIEINVEDISGKEYSSVSRINRRLFDDIMSVTMSGPSAEKRTAKALETIAAVLVEKLNYKEPEPQRLEIKTEEQFRAFFGEPIHRSSNGERKPANIPGDEIVTS